MKTLILTTAFIALIGLGNAHAEDAAYTIDAANGQFSPSTLTIPANQKIKLTVNNKDTAQVEFESYPLNREEKIEPGENTEMYLGPLDAGNYEFFDDNNPDAKGIITVK
jgi:heme/copper-type cytochrome/quinol oxidase subunit 2